MRLLDLPPEIIDLIIGYAMPEGLENFVLTCSAVYRRATSQIKLHNAFRKKWGHTTNASRERHGDTLKILYEISREPNIAWYIKSLSLWDRRTEQDIVDSPAESFRDSDEAMSKIKDFLQDKAYFANVDLEHWWEKIVKEDQDPVPEGVDKLRAIVALLSLLPNLKALQLPDR